LEDHHELGRNRRKVERSQGFDQSKEWGNLTEDDLAYIAGSRDKFAVKLQERYGMRKELAQKRADEWLQTQQDSETNSVSQ
jgi:uncharacterized protein YjbJ (UPF0337 family)